VYFLWPRGGLTGRDFLRSEAMIRDTANGFRKRLEFIAAQIEEHRHAKGRKLQILDVGCGTGIWLTIPLAACIGEVRGIDIDPKAIAFAQEEAARRGLRAIFECVPLESVQDGWFDVIICSEVLEHIPAYDNFFALLVKKLRTDGLLIITVPNGHGPFEIQSWLWRKLFEDTWFHRLLRRLRCTRSRTNIPPAFLDADCGHVNFFSRGDLAKLFERHQMRIKRFEGRTFLCGIFINPFLAHPCLAAINSQLGSRLPAWLVSGWMYALAPSAPAPARSDCS